MGDLESIRNGIKLSRELGSSEEFKKFNPVELFPGPAVQTDEEIDAYIRNSAHSGNASWDPARWGRIRKPAWSIRSSESWESNPCASSTRPSCPSFPEGKRAHR